uniref:Capsid protein n=1 Tax=Parvoviridae sp. TaxID=1940570 RepID=A0A7D3UD49_9VIRU|nr:MAG: capsid protein [Parvoviridae sp.]
MAESHSISNTWMAYIGNQPYIYPNDNKSTIGTGAINTGWHIIPNMLWEHFVTPKQWAEMIIKYEAYHVESIKIQVFNMIPMTQQLAIQGNTVFTAFNNCIYALGYKDELYETSWENWFSPDNQNKGHNLLYKEGLRCNPGTDQKERLMLPRYAWYPPNSRVRGPCTYENWDSDNTIPRMSAVYPAGQAKPGYDNNYGDRPSGVIWDPLNRPKHLMELRPGKNSIGWSWECHACDKDKWFNFDQIAWWYPYTPEGPYNVTHKRPGEYVMTSETDPDRLASRYENNPWINDYTIPNWGQIPVVPMMWWWKEMQESIAPLKESNDVNRRRINQHFVGTEYECYKYGPTQFFIKLIPLFDGNGTHISTTANVSIQTTLNLSCKRRRSAIYAPTWGPFSWYDIYTAQTIHRRFAPALIRYRTGGARRTWQNLADDADDLISHPRETPYNWKSTVPSGTGAGSTYSLYTSPVVTWSKSSDSATIITSSRKRGVVPSAPPMDVDILPADPLYPPIDQLKVHKV